LYALIGRLHAKDAHAIFRVLLDDFETICKGPERKH